MLVLGEQGKMVKTSLCWLGLVGFTEVTMIYSGRKGRVFSYEMSYPSSWL